MVLLSAVAALVSFPAVAGSFTYSNQVAGSSFFGQFVFTSIAEEGQPVGTGLFEYDDGMGGWENVDIRGGAIVLGYYPSDGRDGTADVYDYYMSLDAYEVAFRGILTTMDVTFDDGFVTIYGTLGLVPGATSLFVDDFMGGNGHRVDIPDWDRYFDADLTITFQTSASSLSGLFNGVYGISDAYLVISGTSTPKAVGAIPEPVTMSMFLAGLAGLGCKSYRRFFPKKVA
jgi:hypothetical protein